MPTSIPFTDQSPEAHARKLISPIGAAIVEALPDRVKVNRIKRRFKQGICPPSALFSSQEVVEFYRELGVLVVAEPPTKNRKKRHGKAHPGFGIDALTSKEGG